ncbi:MAG: GDSL family lipase [Betaproteobacteria bacterium HGW-Betaproteobacteria-18]|nr:MAG: GDSL family lipase [Betaproteobacteria bacterium HGW-Betaproteobacteria-18]
MNFKTTLTGRFVTTGLVVALTTSAAFLFGYAPGAYGAAPAVPHVVSFGDSLSDLGTYATRTEGRSAGRFTTNPGPIWIEVVAQGLGSAITLNRHAGWGKPPQAMGGTAYGEGGARVALQPGSNNTDATKGAGSEQTTLPVRAQISAYLDYSHGQFTPDDTVFVWAGANDLFQHAFFAHSSSDAAGDALVREAARDLVAEVKRIGATGATRIVVLNLYDFGQVPFFIAKPKSVVLSAWTRSFNDELASGLAGTPVLLVDLFSLMHLANADPAHYGLKSASSSACKLDDLPQRAVVFCTDQTLVEKDANLNFLYADGLHPTTVGHRIIGEYVLAAMKTAGMR